LSKLDGEIESPPLPCAGLMRRMAALLYDSFLVFAIWMLIGYLIQLFPGVENAKIINGHLVTNLYVDYLLFSLMFFSAAAFYCWFWLRSGQTLGMLAWRLRLKSESDDYLTVKQVFIRWLMAWPSFLLFGVGYFWHYFNKNGDTLHDLISGTKVVLIPKSERPF